MPIPAALAAGIASAVITGVSNVALSERQRKMNEQYQDKMNAYNSPEAMMERLRNAGINPNTFMTANGNLAQGNLSAPINPYQAPNLGDPFAMASNAYLNFAQGKTDDQMRAVRIEEAQANADNLKANAANLNVLTENQSIINRYTAALQENAIRESQGRTAEKYANIAVLRKQADKLAYELQNILPEELQNMIAQRNVNILRLDELVASIADYYASAELKGTQAELNRAETEFTESKTEGQQIENRNAQDIANQVIAHYKSMVDNLASITKKNEEETFWMLFDFLDKNSISILGNKVPISRFGPRSVRDKVGQAVEDRFRKMGSRTYIPGGLNTP